MKIKLIFSIVLATILLTTFASAYVYETNYFYDKQTNQKLTDVSVIGFICDNSDCTANRPLWAGVLNTKDEGSNDAIVLRYPTYLESNYGYAVYFFKPGYFPYKVRADWYGEGRTPKDYTVKLYKLTETASAPVEDFDISDTSVKLGETITISADVLSPRLNTDNIQFIPAELKDNYYSDKVKVSLDIKDSSGKIQHIASKDYNMEWSTEQDILFSFNTKYYPGKEGEYTLILSTEIIDSKFLNTEKVEKTATIKVSTDETPIEDNDAPVITIYYPKNRETYNQVIKYLKFKVEDESQITCKYSTDNRETKINIGCDVETIDLDSKKGTNTWTIYAIDSYGNSAEKSVTFTIKLDNEDEQNKTPTGYRNLNKGDTWEDEQYQNQFKSVVLSDENLNDTPNKSNLIWIIIAIILIVLIMAIIVIILRR